MKLYAMSWPCRYFIFLYNSTLVSACDCYFNAVEIFILHCTENPFYVFPEMKLRGLDHNSYIHVSVSDLYIPWISLPIWQQQNRQTNPGNI